MRMTESKPNAHSRSGQNRLGTVEKPTFQRLGHHGLLPKQASRLHHVLSCGSGAHECTCDDSDMNIDSLMLLSAMALDLTASTMGSEMMATTAVPASSKPLAYEKKWRSEPTDDHM